MSYTNQTQHYGLPQYVGSDVPAYLTDYNNAMATIDQGMNAAKTQADSAATAAGQAANDVSALTSTVNTQATQISAAAQAASNAQNTANTADNKADTNATSISGLDSRVTALENTSGGFEKETITLTNTYYLSITPPAGKIPIASVVTSTTVTGAAAVIGYSTASNSFVVELIKVSSGGITVATGNHTVEVIYL